ncbi:MAG: peptidoglycan DD-metalloendopeptidase family protein [Candidatus Thiodiazotropha sp.]
MLRFSTILVLCLGVVGLAYFQLALSESPDQQAKIKLDLVKKRIQSLQDRLSAAEGERQQKSRELQQTETQIGALTKRIRITKQILDSKRRRLAELEGERSDAQLRLDQHRSSLERQIRAAYIMGREKKMKILLNQQDPSVVSRVLVYYDYLNSARLEQMGQIGKNLQKLNTIERNIAQEEQRLQQLQGENLDQKKQLEGAQLERKEIIASLNSQLKSTGQELMSLKSDEKRLKSLLADLQRALVDIPVNSNAHISFKSRKGKLPWPSKGKLIARFGSAREVGKLKWDGVMIAAPEGQEVRAIHHGRVVFANWLRGFGLLLIIDHGDGFMSLYGHNQSLFKETGEWVEPGEVVAQVGSSGGRSISGIYFGIRYKGQPKNPAQWCQRIKGRIISQRESKELSYYSVTHRSQGNVVVSAFANSIISQPGLLLAAR